MILHPHHLFLLQTAQELQKRTLLKHINIEQFAIFCNHRLHLVLSLHSRECWRKNTATQHRGNGEQQNEALHKHSYCAEAHREESSVPNNH